MLDVLETLQIFEIILDLLKAAIQLNRFFYSFIYCTSYGL